jgi:hypothetical protein
MKHLMAYCLLILIAIAATQPASAQTVEMTFNLQPKFVVGQQSRYSIWTRRATVTEVSIMGRQRKQQSSYIIDGEMTWSVLWVNGDGSATCQMTFDWLSLNMTLPDGSTKHNDTRDGTAEVPTVSAVLTAMVGKPVEVTMSVDGTATAVSGIDAMRSAAGEGVEIPEDLDFIETACDLATLPYAPAQATVSQSWETAFRWTHEMGHMNHAINYTLDGVRNVQGIDLATITGKGILTLDVDQTKLPPQDNVQVDVNLEDGSIQSQILLDMDRHEAVGRNVVMKTRIRMTMDNGTNAISQVTDETIHSQALRISETDPIP